MTGRQLAVRRGVPVCQKGTALVITMMIASLIASLGGALVFLLDVETAISSNYQTAQEMRYAAESAVDCALAELRVLPDWTAVVSGAAGPGATNCLDASAPARTPDGITLDFGRLRAVRQLESDGRYGPLAANANSPQWEVFASGAVDDRTGDFRPRPYVVVWVADDVDDEDDEPRRDRNGVVILRAQAFGHRGARGCVETMVAREMEAGPPGSGQPRVSLRVIGWREVR